MMSDVRREAAGTTHARVGCWRGVALLKYKDVESYFFSPSRKCQEQDDAARTILPSILHQVSALGEPAHPLTSTSPPPARDSRAGPGTPWIR